MRKIFMVMIIFLLFTSPVMASYWDANPPVCENSSDQILLAMSTKFARGITNIITGWMEFPRSIYVTSRDEGIGSGIVVGLFKGIYMTVLRTGAGALETALFMMPTPGYYEAFMDRPLVWSDYDQDEGFLIYKKGCEYGRYAPYFD